MGLLDAFKQYVSDALPGGLLNPEVGRYLDQTQQNIISGHQKRDVVMRGLLSNPMDSNLQRQAVAQGLDMAGMAPLGMIKEVGKIPKKSVFPPSIDPSNFTKEPPEMFGTGMSGSIKKMVNGDFFGRYMPLWGGEGKPFYAVGDNADELREFMLNRMTRSEKGTVSAETKKFNQSLLGQLQKAGYRADEFIPAHSTQSTSEYYTHAPTGVKIRISDHDLPLHYEQPDVDLRRWMTLDEKLQAIKNALGE